MPIIRVPEQALESTAYERLVPGSRVEYRGTSWKVVGKYFAAPGHRAGPAASERTKYVILQSLRLATGALQYLGPLHSS